MLDVAEGHDKKLGKNPLFLSPFGLAQDMGTFGDHLGLGGVKRELVASVELGGEA